METTEMLTVTVLAANGQQSSAIITYLLSLGTSFSQSFRIRAVVRDPSKCSIPESQNHVLEAVAGDMNDKSSLEKAFQDTDILWAMTNPDPARGIEGELQLGRNIVDAFLKCVNDREHMVKKFKPLLLFSSAVDVEAITNGEIRMVNATAKAKIESYIHDLPDSESQKFRFTFVHPGMFMQNFVTYQKPVVDEDGVYHFSGAVRSDAQLPFVDITDLGPLVWHLIQTACSSGEEADANDAYSAYDRATIRLWGELLSYPQLVDRFIQLTGKAAVYDHVGVAKFLSMMFGTSEEDSISQMDSRTRKMEDETVATMIGDMYNLINRYGYYGEDTTEPDDYNKDPRSRKIITQQPSKKTTWSDFVTNHFADPVPATVQAALSLPPTFRTTNKAQNFLTHWFSYFVSQSRKGDGNVSDFEQAILQPYFHPSAVVEFPYFPKGLRQVFGFKPLNSSPEDDGAILEGHAEILAYFRDWRKMFYFEKGKLNSLSALSSPSSTTSDRLTTADGAVAEVRLEGQVTQQGKTKPYIQDYVSLAYVDADGKVLRYQEYWAAERFV